MEVTTNFLMSGGSLEKHKSEELDVTVYSYDSPDGDLSFISPSEYDRMLQRNQVQHREITKCPPPGQPEKTQLLSRPGKPDICVPPQVQGRIEKIMREKNRKDRQMVDEYLDQNDITDLVSPYMNNPALTNVLSHILGRRNVNEMQKLSALVYTGVIKNSCPPPGSEHKTEAYINFLTGKTECREPIPNRPQARTSDGKLWGVDSCPDPHGDPLAVEKYITFFGEGKCRRPVISGAFSCPPADDPDKIHHITLENNIGVCVDDPRTKSPDQRVVMPMQLIYPPEINDEIIRYIKLASQVNFTRDTLNLLSQHLRTNNTVEGLHNVLSGLSGSPHYELVSIIFNNINSPDQIPLAQTAMWEVGKMMAEKGSLNANQFLNHYGIKPEAFVQSGGRRQKMLRQHQK